MPNPRGRPKGVKNKASIAREKAIAESGLTPLQFMVQTMRDESQELPIRLEAAKSAAPYIHPKLSSIEVGNKPGEKFVVQLRSDDEDR